MVAEVSRWSPQQIDFLKRHRAVMTYEQIARAIGRSSNSVRHKWEYLSGMKPFFRVRDLMLDNGTYLYAGNGCSRHPDCFDCPEHDCIAIYGKGRG